MKINGEIKLKYGENPHQAAAWECHPYAMLSEGSNLSLNDVYNVNTGYSLLQYFTQPAAVIIKHANVAGLSVGSSFSVRWKNAAATDRRAAENGILMVNHRLSVDHIREIEAFPFDAVAAPVFEEGISSRLRLLTMRASAYCNLRRTEAIDLIDGTRLVQDTFFSAKKGLDDFEIHPFSSRSRLAEEDVLMSWYTACSVKTNCAVIASGGRTLAVAAGHQDGTTAVEHAIHKAIYHAHTTNFTHAVIAVDGNFPHEIPVQQITKANISAFILPGMARNDDELLNEFVKTGCTILFSKERCFLH